VPIAIFRELRHKQLIFNSYSDCIVRDRLTASASH